MTEGIALRDTLEEELARIAEMEQRDGHGFVSVYPLDRHRAEFARPEVTYKSVYVNGAMAGFVLLVLDPDGLSVEFRRIVIAAPGRGYGRRVVGMIPDICRRELGRERVWLDVYETNTRARRIYERCGFRQFGTAEQEGCTLLLYERNT